MRRGEPALQAAGARTRARSAARPARSSAAGAGCRSGRSGRSSVSSASTGSSLGTVRSRPVATSVIETSPSIRVESEVRRPRCAEQGDRIPGVVLAPARGRQRDENLRPCGGVELDQRPRRAGSPREDRARAVPAAVRRALIRGSRSGRLRARAARRPLGPRSPPGRTAPRRAPPPAAGAVTTSASRTSTMRIRGILAGRNRSAVSRAAVRPFFTHESARSAAGLRGPLSQPSQRGVSRRAPEGRRPPRSRRRDAGGVPGRLQGDSARHPSRIFPVRGCSQSPRTSGGAASARRFGGRARSRSGTRACRRPSRPGARRPRRSE